MNLKSFAETFAQGELQLFYVIVFTPQSDNGATVPTF
jgi:hypothetical protein